MSFRAAHDARAVHRFLGLRLRCVRYARAEQHAVDRGRRLPRHSPGAADPDGGRFRICADALPRRHWCRSDGARARTLLRDGAVGRRRIPDLACMEHRLCTGRKCRGVRQRRTGTARRHRTPRRGILSVGQPQSLARLRRRNFNVPLARGRSRPFRRPRSRWCSWLPGSPAASRGLPLVRSFVERCATPAMLARSTSPWRSCL